MEDQAKLSTEEFEKQNEIALGTAGAVAEAASKALEHGAPVKESMSVMDLPAEVRNNLVGLEDMELDEMITAIVDTCKTPIKCDRIVQLLWVQYKRSPKRVRIMARLRYLCALGTIEKFEGVRSTYCSLTGPARRSALRQSILSQGA